jgi:predicted DNA binding CopG/RHH family protein
MVEVVKPDQMTVIHSVSEIPQFQSEGQEAEFWQTHRFSDKLLAEADPTRDEELPPARTKSVSFRLDEHTLARAKALAESRGIGYQTMLKTFIMERLYEEEQRSGIVRRGFRWSKPKTE